MNLNEKQKQAVLLGKNEDGLIIAGAGSGKTKVLVSRVGHLLRDQKVNPSEILAVTFTNKAAKEMVERLERDGIETKGLWVGTFHGICNRLLRIFHEEAGLTKNFAILDVDDSKSVIKKVWKGLIENKVLPEVDIKKEKGLINEMHEFISKSKEKGIRSKSLPKRSPWLGKDEDWIRIIKVYEGYEAQCQKEGVVDFSELMLKTMELFKENERVLEWVQKKFKNILVDEFQDTNKLQYEWIKKIAKKQDKKISVFAVGDGDQSIYGFRGAVVENIELFRQEFGLQDHQLIKLEQNYRSVGGILKTANSLIEKNQNRIAKNLWTDQGDGKKIVELECWNEEDEAISIVNEYAKVKKIGGNLKECAILYRTNAQSRLFEQGLIASGIPYRIYGGLKFFERAEIKNALAYVRLSMNEKDEGALRRIINVPARGIGEKTIEKISFEAQLNSRNLFEQLKIEALKPGKVGDAIKSLVKIIERIQESHNKKSLYEIFEETNQLSGLNELYKDEEERLENLRELENAAGQFERNAPKESESEDPLIEFLANAALAVGETGAKEDENAVQLMTVHASKGLEFDRVWVVGLEDGVFPSLKNEDDDKNLEEERRLMYVAMTRARKELGLSYTNSRYQYGERKSMEPSRFLSEMASDWKLVGKTERRELEIQNEKKYRSNEGWGSKTKDGNPWGNNDAWVDKGVSNKKSAEWGDKIDDGYTIKTRIAHSRFGEGTVMKREKRDGDISLLIHFDSGEKRELLLSFAKSKMTILGKKIKFNN